MSVITDTWRQLVQRRLWPVAGLLVAALAAVPFLLAKDPEPTAAVAPATPAESGRGVLASDPLVSIADTADRAKRRKVLGVRHDIFKPTKKAPKVAKEKAGETVAVAVVSGGGDTGSTGGGSVAVGGGGGTDTVAPVDDTTTDVPTTGGDDTTSEEPTTPAEPEETLPADAITVRFGDPSSDELEKRTLERLEPLPSAEEPVAIYLGLAKDGKTALFLIDAGVQPTGDGECRPDPTSCETLALKAGETEFLDIVDAAGTITAQYQLDVVKVHRSADADDAKSAKRLIKAYAATVGPLAWRHRAAGLLKRP